MFSISHYINRTRKYTINLFEEDGTTECILAADDEVRFKIGRGTNSPTLDLVSYDTEPGGSTVAFTAGTNDAELTIGQADVRSLEPGAYDCEIIVVDNSQSIGSPTEKEVKHAEFGVFFLHPVPGGEISDEESSSSSSNSSSSQSSQSA